MVPIGLILIALWRHLWQCVIEYNKWSVDMYFSSVQTQRFALGYEERKKNRLLALGLDVALITVLYHRQPSARE